MYSPDLVSVSILEVVDSWIRPSKSKATMEVISSLLSKEISLD